MKSSRPPFGHNPFRDLKDRLGKRSLPVKVRPPERGTSENTEAVKVSPQEEERLFLDAMDDVTPIANDDRVTRPAGTRSADFPAVSEGDETLRALRELVVNGKGFIVADTPEYVEGTGYQGDIGLARRLHRGDFSIQAHIDLHGLTVEEAAEVVERFLWEAVLSGKRAVSIIHGRGLSSPAEPVLKNKVIEWLTSGHWRKWVIAYASARACDGGAGATYVLLRRRPYSRPPSRKPLKGTTPSSLRS